MLKVRVVEMQRSVIKQLGFNLNAVPRSGGQSAVHRRHAPPPSAVNGAIAGRPTGRCAALNTTTQPETMATAPQDRLRCICRGRAARPVPFGLAWGQLEIRSRPSKTDRRQSTGVNQASIRWTPSNRWDWCAPWLPGPTPGRRCPAGSAKFLASGGCLDLTRRGQRPAGSVHRFEVLRRGPGSFTPVVLSGGLISARRSRRKCTRLVQPGILLPPARRRRAPPPARRPVPRPHHPGALKVRRAETTVELPSGGAMIVAGLMQQEIQPDAWRPCPG